MQDKNTSQTVRDQMSSWRAVSWAVVWRRSAMVTWRCCLCVVMPCGWEGNRGSVCLSSGSYQGRECQVGPAVASRARLADASSHIRSAAVGYAVWTAAWLADEYCPGHRWICQPPQVTSAADRSLAPALNLTGVTSYGALGHMPPPQFPTIYFFTSLWSYKKTAVSCVKYFRDFAYRSHENSSFFHFLERVLVFLATRCMCNSSYFMCPI